MAENDQSELADFLSQLPPVTEDDEEVEAMLTKFVLVSEWMDGEGNRYLTIRSGNGAGEAIPDWEKRGILFHTLFGDFKIIE